MDIYLDKDNNPHICVKPNLVLDTNIDCFIDTGFAGGIALPKYYMSLLKDKTVIALQRYELADGKVTVFDVYKLKLTFRRKYKFVSAVFTDSKAALIGIEYLTGYVFTLNLKEKTIDLK
jgi:predicted aspartyl protease